jgi:hypothetical protein
VSTSSLLSQFCCIHQSLFRMLNILQRNPVELCSVLLLLAGLGQASPVDLEVCSSVSFRSRVA